MAIGRAHAGPARDESKRRVMDRNAIKNLAQDPPLNRLQSGFRRFEKTRRTFGSGREFVVIIRQAWNSGRRLKATRIREPVEFARAQIEPCGEIAMRRKPRNVERRKPLRRRENVPRQRNFLLERILARSFKVIGLQQKLGEPPRRRRMRKFREQ